MLNLKLFDTYGELSLRTSRYDATMKRVMADLRRVPKRIDIDLGASTAKLTPALQQVRDLRAAAARPIAVRFDTRGLGRPGGGRGGRGGGGCFLGGVGQGLGLPFTGGSPLAAAGYLAGAGAAGVARGMFAAARKASDLGESVSKVRVSFGDSAGKILDTADALAHKFGVVKQETLDAAAAFGLMGRAAGMTQDDSAALGSEFVKMGLDLASFHNISNVDAFEKLRSGLAGEIEPLRSIGILLSEDAVQARAVADGLAATKTEASHLSQQAKVGIRVKLIREGMGPAAGDLERTADSAANQLRKLQGELTNAAVAFGQDLQGALTDGIKLAREIGAILGKANFGAGVGELTRGGINAGRTAVGGHLPEMLAVGAARSLLSVHESLGLPTFGALDAVNRRMEEMVSQSTGMPLAVASDQAGADAGVARAAANRKLLPGLFGGTEGRSDDDRAKVVADRIAAALSSGGRAAAGVFGAGGPVPFLASRQEDRERLADAAVALQRSGLPETLAKAAPLAFGLSGLGGVKGRMAAVAQLGSTLGGALGLADASQDPAAAPRRDYGVHLSGQDVLDRIQGDVLNRDDDAAKQTAKHTEPLPGLLGEIRDALRATRPAIL